MSYCNTGTRNGAYGSNREYLQTVAQELRGRLQCWISNFLYHGWMHTNRIFDSAQDGCLLFPLGLIRVDPVPISPSVKGIYLTQNH